MLYFLLLEIQVVIITSAPAIISTLAFVSLIPSPAESTLPASPPDTSFPAIPINLIISSRRLMSQLTLKTRKGGQRSGRNTSIKLSKNENTKLRI
jgi:hypothetical protein